MSINTIKKEKPVIIDFEKYKISPIYYLIPDKGISFSINNPQYNCKKFIKNFTLETINIDNKLFYIIKPKQINIQITEIDIDHNKNYKYIIRYDLVINKLLDIEIEKIKYDLISNYNNYLVDTVYSRNTMNENYTTSKASFCSCKNYIKSAQLPIDIKLMQTNIYQYEISKLLDQ